MDLDSAFPAINDLAGRARRRMPKFVWEYLVSATGEESTAARNRAALDNVLLRPGILRGEIVPDLTASFLGRSYPMPFGVAPVGMSGLIWPGAETRLARMAAANGIPYALSTVASQTPETLAAHIGDQGWFQLYPPRDPEIRRDLLARARDSGFHTLVLTADVPAASRRERQRRSGLTHPPRMTPRILTQVLRRPTWALATLKHGTPRFHTLEKYQKAGSGMSSTAHIGYLLRVAPDWDYLKALRDEWDGPLVVKGVLNPDDALRLRNEGVDAVWVSNHAGRQFDAAPAALAALRDIRATIGPDFPLLYDGAVASGLDILRAIAMGANFVMLGKAFHYGLAAFGDRGAAHVVHVLREDMLASMSQIGACNLAALPGALIAE